MKKIDIGQIITILANVGVLAGIVFVAYEIRQSNRIAIAFSRNLCGTADLRVVSLHVADIEFN